MRGYSNLIKGAIAEGDGDYGDDVTMLINPTPDLTTREIYRMGKKEKDRYILKNFINIYCRGKHKTPKGHLCNSCQDLLNYALKRLERCPQDPKPSCKHCQIHCYKPAYREEIRQVMRYSGKRLILRGRLDLLWHYLF